MKGLFYFGHFPRLACSAVLVACTSVAHADPGNHLWANIYGDVTGNDGVNAVALDSTGNVFAAGYEWIGNGTNSSGRDAHAVKYDGDGNQVTTGWPVIYDSGISYSQDSFVSAAVDSGDNLISGGTEQNPSWADCNVMIIAKHNSAGVEQWKNSYGRGAAPSGDPHPTWWDCWHVTYSAVVDGNNNIYAAGRNFTGWNTNRMHDWIIFKFNLDGNIAEGFPVRHTNKVTPGYVYNEYWLQDFAFGAAVNGEGEFTAVGVIGVSHNNTSDRADDNNDWHVRKYEHVDTNADTVPDTVNLLWSDTHNGSTHRNDAAYHPAIDSNGDIIVIGYTNKGSDNSTNVDYDWLVIKYAKDGDGVGNATRLWTKTYESAAGRSETPGLAAVAVDEHDNVYIGGYERDASGMIHWRLEYRYGDTGNLLHQWVWSDIEGGISALALRGGKLAITGSRKNTAGNNDWYTQLYEIAAGDAMLRNKAAVWAGKRKHGVLYEPISFSGIYGDVAVDDYAAYWIEQISTDGITDGCDSDPMLFCPKDVVTKGQAVKLILKAAGETANSPVDPLYADVPITHTDAGWIDRANELGVTTGCGDGSNFCPEEVLTEQGFQQMADGVF